MLKRKKRAKSALLLALLLAPAAAYAVWMLTLFLLDSFGGDGLMRHQYEFESRRALAAQLWSDARQALPVFYGAGLLLWLEIHLLSRLGDWNGLPSALLAGALTGLLVVAVFAEWSFGLILPAVLAGALIAIALSLAVRPSRLQP